MSSATQPRRFVRIVATTLVALALVAPVASARPGIAPPAKSPTGIGLSAYDATPDPSPVVLRTADNGLDWGSVGVGAAAAGALVLIAVGGFTAAHRTRTRPAR